MKTHIFWQIMTSDSSYHSKNGDWRFDSEKEAVEEATKFKADPNNHNNSMTEENKAYKVQKVTEIIEDILTI